LACLLGSLVLLGSSAEPPIVSIASLPEIEDGSVVRVIGVLIAHKRYDSGAEGLTLADLEDGAVTRVVSSPGIRPQPSVFADIGDEVLVKGEVSINGSSAIVFVKSDDVSISRASELVLTVESLSKNWLLFDGDTVRVRGVIELTGEGAGMRLRDLSSGCSIVMLQQSINLGQFVGATATVTAEVRYDFWLSMLILVPCYVAAEQ
jgi:hypothetical protein